MHSVRIPSYRELARKIDPWKTPSAGQDLNPTEALHEKLFIKRGAKVLFFAGADGDWANQLAQTTNVHYTDASREMVEHAKERFAGKGIRSFRRADAMRWPWQRYDYVASFEPIPLAERLPLIALRALVHCRGMRIIEHHPPILFRILNKVQEHLSRHYNVMPVSRNVHIHATTRTYRKIASKERFRVWKFNSSKKARRKAKLDLAVISALQRRNTIRESELKETLKKQGITRSLEEVRQSLERVHALGTMLESTAFGIETTKKVKILRG